MDTGVAIDLVAIGEVMLELSGGGKDAIGKQLPLGVAGDTFNTVVYASRKGCKASYFTQLGDDVYSAQMLDFLTAEGIDVEHIARVPNRMPGLYMISNLPGGERIFSYWRDNSPAREMCSTEASEQALRAALAPTKMAYLSGISLGILSAQGIETLFKVLADFRTAGGKVVFDSNYRPRLWKTKENAQDVTLRALLLADMALLTDEDEHMLWGSNDMASLVDRYSAGNLTELVLKRGAEDVLYSLRASAGETFAAPVSIPVPKVHDVVDTTAAGDSFNGAYLATRVQGGSVEDSIRSGCACAGLVIRHKGAITPRDMPL
ncbi:MAG: sugar kinase [Marinagarivorans sp.]|nr:sugar kinase [Marinagarivorans sp.]